jgi:sugar phosphate isomerase/epimerase
MNPDKGKAMRTGLVSVTFRALPADDVLRLMRRSGLGCVEWGGDVHVPPGRIALAEAVGTRTREAGIDITAYGSYYRLDVSEREGAPFTAVLDAAVALGAPAIRVWAGSRSKAVADPGHVQRVADDALRIADLAMAAGRVICLEYHPDTLTDSAESARQLLKMAKHPAVFSLWQTPVGESPEECVNGLRAVIARLHHVHVFHWWPDPAHRLALAEGEERWKVYLRLLAAGARKPDLLLEFLPGDSPAMLDGEAATLRRWLSEIGEPPPA